MIIGLLGEAGHGKDTVAKILVSKRGFKRYAFADNLKKGLTAMLPFIDFSKYAKEDIIPELGVSLRYLYQTLGTDWGRVLVNEDMWTLELEMVCSENFYLGANTVISDVRYKNEADKIRSLGGLLVRVSSSVRVTPIKENGHISEVEGASIPSDYVLFNNRTEMDLEGEITKLFKYFEEEGLI